ncbi:hypothetical protein [Paraburkholderia gardini]|uniref:hypothetical protein n=1 Tax=Paraburkholderia gardini TaxID=2823469 RepID=UPI001DA96C61|nr:hypothetical protein [Paraburkholderia gardini]CAG4891483.1 hypothetical protein R69919_01191 [Paraburkholderia gardini]
MSKSALSVGYALVSPYNCAIQIDGSGSRERFFSTIDVAMTRLVEAHANARAEMLSASDEVAAANLTTSVGSLNGIHLANISIPATMTAEELNGWLPKIRACAIDLFEHVSELTTHADTMTEESNYA